MKNKLFRLVLFATLMLSSLTAGTRLPEQTAAAPSSTPAQTLQFQSGGHILGFGQSQVYLAGLDHALRVEFAGGNAVAPSGAGASAQAGRPVPMQRVSYVNAWNGVDVAYTPAANGLAESTYTVRPGGKVGSIRLRYNVPVPIQPDGSLRYTFQTGYISESAPLAWQEIAGKRLAVPVQFVEQAKNEVSFAVGAYDLAYPLTIDPSYSWHTFIGTENNEFARAIAVDGSGNLYVAGNSDTGWNDGNGLAAVPPKHAYTGGLDMLVVKLNSNGAYLWHTFYGSTAADSAYSIAVDGSGNVYVAGSSDNSWDYIQNTTDTQPINQYQGGADMVVLKLDTNGNYLWHTFLGSLSGNDQAFGVAVDGSGNVYVAGSSTAAWNYAKTDHGAANDFVGSNANIAITRLDTNGTYVWHTFYGASGGNNQANAIAVDGSGNIYVAGLSAAGWGSAPVNAHSTGSNNDVVVLKLTQYAELQWNTFLGSSSGDDEATSLSLDASDNVYIAGFSNASWGYGSGIQKNPINAYKGDYDMVVVKLDSDGGYQWHTFLGSSSDDDEAYGIAINNAGYLYVTGFSEASWNYPVGIFGSIPPLNPYAGGYDIVLVKVKEDGTYQWHTFYGSASGDDFGEGIALNRPASSISLAGYCGASWNGPAGQTAVYPYSGDEDMCVVNMSDPYQIFLPTIMR